LEGGGGGETKEEMGKSVGGTRHEGALREDRPRRSLQDRKRPRDRRSHVRHGLRRRRWRGKEKKPQKQSGYQANTARIAEETASGFSRGRKWPAPAMTRRAISLEN